MIVAVVLNVPLDVLDNVSNTFRGMLLLHRLSYSFSRHGLRYKLLMGCLE